MKKVIGWNLKRIRLEDLIEINLNLVSRIINLQNYDGQLLYENVKKMKVVAVALLILTINIFMIQPLYAEGTTWEEDSKKAVLKYAENKAHDSIKSNTKSAIIALYKRLYNTGADKSYSSTLARISLSTSEINQLAESTADAFSSNDPNKVQAASEALAISLGNEMVKLAKRPELQGHLKSVMGKAGSIKDVSGLLGAAGTTSGNLALAEYAGQVLIDLTPAAGVVAFYKSSYGAMKYVNDQFVSGAMEDLYETYKKHGSKGIEEVGLLLDAGKKYGYVVRQRRMDLIAKTKALNIDANPSQELIEHLAKASDDEIKRDILASFKKRQAKEEEYAEELVKRKEYEQEAEAILDTFDSVAFVKYGKDWYKKHPWQLADFTEKVQQAIRENGVLDYKNIGHIRAMSRLMAVRLIYTKNSPEYQIELAKVKKIQNGVLSANNNNGWCLSEASKRLAQSLLEKGYRYIESSKPELGFKYLSKSLKVCNNTKLEAELLKLKKEYSEDKTKFLEKIAKSRQDKLDSLRKEKRELVMKNLAKLNHAKFLDTLKTLKMKSYHPFLNCLCNSAAYGTTSTKQFYHPDTLGKYDKRYTCNQPGEPCVVAGFGCSRHPLPSDSAIWKGCMQKYKINTKNTFDEKVGTESGVQLDEHVEKVLRQRITK